MQDFVFITEGEADADRLNSLNLVATTSGSSTSWHREFSKHFKGRLACITPDNDAPGERYAKDILNSLYGIAAEVRVLRLPNLKESEDVSDWLNNGGTTEKLLGLVDKTEPSKPEPDIKIHLTSMESVATKKTDWFIDNKIPAGSISMFVGDCGSGKSFLTTCIAAKVSTGDIWPDGTKAKKGEVIILNDEDSPCKIRERLVAHNADLRKIHILKGVNDGEFFDLVRHIEGLDDILTNCRLLVIDPITAYLGKVNANSNADVRAALTPLAALAEKHNTTVLIINHLNKKADLAHIYRGLGSTAFVAQSRSVWGVLTDKDDCETRIFCPVKTNYSINPTGLKFRIIDGAIQFEPEPWLGHIDDANKTIKNSDAAAKWLKDKLKDGCRLSDTLLDEGRAEGFGRNLLFRVKKELGIRASKEGFGGKWMWRLADDQY
jgi:archaellum biogenesis ATPase FlaH